MRYLTFQDLQAKLGGRGRTTIYRDVESGQHMRETGTLSGLSREAVGQLFEELRATIPDALEATLNGLPKGFPDELGNSLQGTVETRLKFLD